MKRKLILPLLLLFVAPVSFAGWEAGAAKADITPANPYRSPDTAAKRACHSGSSIRSGSRRSPSKTTRARPQSSVTADLVGLSGTMTARIAKNALENITFPEST